jgi:outer membrane receptor protein involved in Fe transport
MRRFLPAALLIVLAGAPGSVWADPAGGEGLPGPVDETGRISGSVSGPDGQPLQNVGVTLRAAEDSSLVTGTLTDARGHFELEELPFGTYILHVGMLGYRSRSSEEIRLTAEDPHVDLGEIPLETSPIQVDELEAAVDRPTVVVEADRTVYDVRQMPVAGTGSATDVLRAVPELEVDVDDRVRLRGNQAAAIHVNGRPTPMRGEQLADFLRQLPGDRLDRIEVLPNPSARHDPEGMGGIVNIVLREDVELGLSGSVNVNASTRGRQVLSGRFNVQRGRLTLFSGAGVNRSHQESSSWDLRRNLVTDPVTVIEQSSVMDNRSRGWNLDWTAELNVGEGATLWSNAWLFHSGHGSDGVAEYGITDDQENIRERYDRLNDRESSSGNYNFTLGYKKVFEQQREELTVDARFSRGGNDLDAVNTRLFYVLAGEPADRPLELTLNEIDRNNGNLSIQADYFRPVAGGRVDVGYRAWQRDQDNDNLLRVFESAGDAEPVDGSHAGFEYREVFHSLYTTFARSEGRFRAQLGLRAELASTTFDSRVVEDGFEQDYRTLFPSLNLSFEPRPGHTLRALYSRRISRPPPVYLDPFVPSTDPLNRFFGNPELEPSLTDSYTLDFTWNGQRSTVRVAPYYRSSRDVWERIRTVDTLGVATSRWENAASSRALGTNLTFSLRPTGRLSGSTNFGIFRDVRDGTNISGGLERSAVMWSVGGNLGFRVSETLTAQVMANHFPTQTILQGRASGYTFTTLALRQQLFDRRGSLSLNVSDPFDMNRYTSTVSDPTFEQQSRSSFRSRMITVGFTVNLGQAPQRQSRPGAGPDDGGAGETIRVP